MKKMKLDANEGAIFEKQLEYVKSRSYDTKYKTLKAFELFPLNTSTPSGSTEITFKRYSGVGFAKVVADYSNDFPRVDLIGEEITSKVKVLGASYGYSVMEIRRAQIAGLQLETRRANTARRAIEQKHNAIALTGDTTNGLNGFINYPGITSYTVPNGASLSTEWSTKTPDEIIADMNGIITAITTATNGVESPDTMLLPIEQYDLISGTRMTGDSDKTILGFFLENNQYINRVEWLAELNGAGAAGADRFMVYSNTPEHLEMEAPTVFETHEASHKGMEYEIPVSGETGGIIVYYPLSIAYGDGI